MNIHNLHISPLVWLVIAAGAILLSYLGYKMMKAFMAFILWSFLILAILGGAGYFYFFR